MTRALATRYLDFMPFTLDQLPPGKDWARDVPCHCALGVMHQVLSACGLAVDDEVPWIKPWFLRYQLPDGGLNCEGDAYVGSRKSSVVSTVPVLEAMLAAERGEAERAFVDRGARYLIAHRLVRSSSGAVIDAAWLKPCFPRFYEYDVLRGADFLLAWAAKRATALPAGTLRDAAPWLEDGRPRAVEREALTTRSLVHADSTWSKGESSRFALLDVVSRPGYQPWSRRIKSK
jgi:hypothetical protein